MVKKLVQQIAAVLLLGVFCLYITPRDYLHHFTGHEDTQDETCMTTPLSGPVFSTQHQHCDWLNWTLEGYVDAPLIAIPSTLHTYKALLQELPALRFQYPPYYFSLRAPPSVSV